MAVTLIIVGTVLLVGSIVFALVSMGNAVNTFLSDNGDDNKPRGLGFIGGVIKRHVGAMIGVTIGSLMIFIGLIMAVVQIIQKLQ